MDMNKVSMKNWLVQKLLISVKWKRVQLVVKFKQNELVCVSLINQVKNTALFNLVRVQERYDVVHITISPNPFCFAKTNRRFTN